MSRLFFALWPDDLVRQQIAKVAAQLPSYGNRVKAANFHATLAFLGEVSDDQRDSFIKAAGQISSDSFDLQLDSREWWKKSQVTCMGASDVPDPLFQLIDSLNKVLEPCGYKAEKRTFKLHITLMRKVEKPINPIQFKPIPWLVHGFSLVESKNTSDGVEYKVIKTWDFV